MIGRWYSSESTIKKSEVTPFHSHDARNRCAESLYPFSLQSLEWRMANLFVRNVLYHTLKFMLTSNSNYRRFFFPESWSAFFLLVRLLKNKYHTVGKLLERAPWNALKTLEMKLFTNTMYGPCNVRSIYFSLTLCSEKVEISGDCGLSVVYKLYQIIWWEHCEHGNILISEEFSNPFKHLVTIFRRTGLSANLT